VNGCRKRYKDAKVGNFNIFLNILF
jgi:hypothetical protein